MQADPVLTFQSVYCVTTIDPGKEARCSIGIRPSILSDTFRVRWMDTEGHTQIVDYRKQSDLSLKVQNYLNKNPVKYPEHFNIVDRDHQRTYQLDKLTLDVYNQRFKNFTGITFTSDKELQEFYLNHSFGE